MSMEEENIYFYFSERWEWEGDEREIGINLKKKCKYTTLYSLLNFLFNSLNKKEKNQQTCERTERLWVKNGNLNEGF